MSEHTLGPWHWSKGNLLRVNAGPQQTICGVHRQGRLRGEDREAECMANARLIAAAPRMLRDLCDASDPSTPEGMAAWPEWNERRKATIAKAEGREP